MCTFPAYKYVSLFGKRTERHDNEVENGENCLGLGEREVGSPSLDGDILYGLSIK